MIYVTSLYVFLFIILKPSLVLTILSYCSHQIFTEGADCSCAVPVGSPGPLFPTDFLSTGDLAKWKKSAESSF